MGLVFLAALVLAVIVSLARAQPFAANHIATRDVDYRTSPASTVQALELS